MKFWNWIQDRLGITALSAEVSSNTEELARLRKKVTRKPKRFDQIERKRSQRRHPNRHH